MKNLTEKQINSVIEWMNEWEQLKDTVIPLRFKSHFTKEDNSSTVFFKYPTPGLSTHIQPIVILKGYEKIENQDNKKLMDLINEIKYECHKLNIDFKGEVFEKGTREVFE